MKKQKIIILILILILVFPLLLGANEPVKYSYITDKQFNYYTGILKGEGGELNKDLDVLACTVLNRLNKGWSSYSVMSQYYAPYRQPTKEEINIVKQVILYKKDCLPVYFFVSDWYAKKYVKIEPFYKLEGHSFYRYEDYKNMY